MTEVVSYTNLDHICHKRGYPTFLGVVSFMAIRHLRNRLVHETLKQLT